MDDETMPEPMTPSQLADLRGRSDASMPWTQGERNALLAATEERDRYRPVVEAAIRWRRCDLPGDDDCGNKCGTLDDLADAVDALEALPAPEPTDGK
jgi:hypothetical protein